jgi:membrane-associated phospholipid phosphatase
MLAITAGAACSDGITSPSREAGPTTVVRWNVVARELVIVERMAPPKASRVYAYLSAAQYGAAIASRVPPSASSLHALLNPPFGRTEAAIANASARILMVMFPNQGARISQALQADRAGLRARGATPSAVDSGATVGGEIAGILEARASSDGSDTEWAGTVPNGPGLWNGGSPQLPAWGLVRPWLWASGQELRAPSPPAFDSDEFRAALAEVRQISDARTPAQLEIARFWADGAGTYTPPGHWNELAAELINSSGMSELHAARTMALVNVAMMDAVIGCWDTKYAYWLLRPYQADPGISTPIGQPPHPSYPSGHACSSGAAASVLGALFPARAAELEELAVEACDSRVYAGIHYRFDAEAGMAIGTKAAARALERADTLVRSIIPTSPQPDHGVIATGNAS